MYIKCKECNQLYYTNNSRKDLNEDNCNLCKGELKEINQEKYKKLYKYHIMLDS